MNKQRQQEVDARKIIREFDQKLLAKREYDRWIYKCPFLMLEGFCLLGALLAVCWKNSMLFLVLSFISAESIRWQLGFYMGFQGQSVYKLLSYCPVRKKDILIVRLGYLRDMMARRTGIWSCVQLLFMLYCGSVRWESIKMVLVFVIVGSVYNVVWCVLSYLE